MPAFNPSNDKLVTTSTQNLKEALRVDARDYEALILSNLGMFDVLVQNATPTSPNRDKLWYHADVRQFKRWNPLASTWSVLVPNQLALHIMHRVALGAQTDTVMETGDRLLFWDISVSDFKQITRENLRTDIGADEASDAEIRTGVVGKFVSARRAFTANAPVTINASQLNGGVNFNSGINFVCSLGNDVALGNPTNAKPGQSGQIIIKHSNRRLTSKGSAWRFPGGLPSLSSGSSMTDVISYYVETTGLIYGTLAKGFE